MPLNWASWLEPEIDDGHFTLSEYQIVVKKHRCYKASYDDQICVDLLKNCDFEHEIMDFVIAYVLVDKNRSILFC